jgi:hypothetical protein
MGYRVDVALGDPCCNLIWDGPNTSQQQKRQNTNPPANSKSSGRSPGV